MTVKWGNMTRNLSSKFPALFMFFLCLSLHLSLSSSADGLTGSQQCVDGTYQHGGNTCCQCGAGQYVEEHCSTGQNTKCKACDEDTYSSHPNNQESCEPCTSCSQPNANLEVEERCTRARDTKCRCKKDHYCSSGTETCEICFPCKECAEGIKIACTAQNNTVCEDKTEGGYSTVIVPIVIIGVLLLIGIVLAVLWKKRRDRKRQHSPNQPISGSSGDAEMELLPVVDLQPHLHDLAEVIGPKAMREVAMRSGIPDTVIESCQLDHQGDCEEQTIKLLKIFVERQGREASRNLVHFLQNTSKKGKAEKVLAILSRSEVSNR